MQALKALVILMAVAIVAILAVIIVAIVQRVGDGGVGDKAPATERRAADFGARDLALPAGCTIAQADLADGRLLLRLDGPADCQKVVLFDAESGAQLGSVTGRPAP